MFIDINAYVGHWPFRNLKYNTVETLDQLAQQYDITHMIIANLNGFFYKDANAANLELLEEMKNYHGKTVFLPTAVVNPLYPEWEADAREMIEAGFMGFELAPLYHGYKLGMQPKYDSYYGEQVAAPVMALAEELDVPVRICASLENIRGRGRMDIFENISGDDYYALLSKYPNVHVFCTSFSAPAAGEKFGALLKERKNTYLDNSQGETQLTGLQTATMKVLSKDQLCFGSLSPFAYMESSLLKMEYSAEYDTEAMKTNAARAFKCLR